MQSIVQVTFRECDLYTLLPYDQFQAPAPAFHARTDSPCAQERNLASRRLVAIPHSPLNPRCFSFSAESVLQTMAAQDGHPPAKRRKFDADLPIREATTQHGRILRGVDRPISPPLTERKNNGISETVPTPSWGFGDVPRAASPSAAADLAASSQPKAERDGMCIESTKYVRAPVQLTRIEDLAPHENVDAVGLRDILGDPMIKECWNFNYLHDINFVM